MTALAAVIAVFRASAGLDGQQGAFLHLSWIVIHPMHIRRSMHEFEKRRVEDVCDLFSRPIVAHLSICLSLVRFVGSAGDGVDGVPSSSTAQDDVPSFLRHLHLVVFPCHLPLVSSFPPRHGRMRRRTVRRTDALGLGFGSVDGERDRDLSLVDRKGVSFPIGSVEVPFLSILSLSPPPGMGTVEKRRGWVPFRSVTLERKGDRHTNTQAWWGERTARRVCPCRPSSNGTVPPPERPGLEPPFHVPIRPSQVPPPSKDSWDPGGKTHPPRVGVWVCVCEGVVCTPSRKRHVASKRVGRPHHGAVWKRIRNGTGTSIRMLLPAGGGDARRGAEMDRGATLATPGETEHRSLERRQKEPGACGHQSSRVESSGRIASKRSGKTARRKMVLDPRHARLGSPRSDPRHLVLLGPPAAALETPVQTRALHAPRIEDTQCIHWIQLPLDRSPSRVPERGDRDLSLPHSHGTASCLPHVHHPHPHRWTRGIRGRAVHSKPWTMRHVGPARRYALQTPQHGPAPRHAPQVSIQALFSLFHALGSSHGHHAPVLSRGVPETF